MSTKRKLVYLEVDDHGQSAGWKLADRIKTSGQLIKVVGWIVKESPDYVVISQGYVDADDDFVLGYFTIIRSAIKKKRILKI